MKTAIFFLSLLLMLNCSFLLRTSSSGLSVKEYNEKSIKTVRELAVKDLKCNENNIEITVLKKSGIMYKELKAEGCNKNLDYINDFGWKLKPKSE